MTFNVETMKDIDEAFKITNALYTDFLRNTAQRLATLGDNIFNKTTLFYFFPGLTTARI